MDAIRARNLSFAYRRFPWSRPQFALRDASLVVAPGTLHLLAGANGAGKSTLLRLLAGIALPSSGELELLGLRAGAKALRGRVAWMPEASHDGWGLPIESMVELAAELHGFSGAARREQVDRALADVQLEPLRRRQWSTISKGERRRAAVAQALATGAELLLLDEPLDGVDPESAERLLERLVARTRAGATVVVSSHVLLDGTAGGDVLTVLDGGRVVASGRPAELLRDAAGARVTFAQLLRSTRSGG